MRIDEILAASTEPNFSVEFFPPKTEEGRESLFETVGVLRVQAQPTAWLAVPAVSSLGRESAVSARREWMA